MARVKIEQTSEPIFTSNHTIRVDDLNYGNHLSNDRVLVLAHQARIEFLASIGASELDFYGESMIQADAAIIYQSEGHLNDKVQINIGVQDISRVGFVLVYAMQNTTTNKPLALVKTGLICYNYREKKVKSLPKEFLEKAK